jgi:hypothetical protein
VIPDADASKKPTKHSATLLACSLTLLCTQSLCYGKPTRVVPCVRDHSTLHSFAPACWGGVAQIDERLHQVLRLVDKRECVVFSALKLWRDHQTSSCFASTSANLLLVCTMSLPVVWGGSGICKPLHCRDLRMHLRLHCHYYLGLHLHCLEPVSPKLPAMALYLLQADSLRLA